MVVFIESERRKSVGGADLEEEARHEGTDRNKEGERLAMLILVGRKRVGALVSQLSKAALSSGSDCNWMGGAQRLTDRGGFVV